MKAACVDYKDVLTKISIDHLAFQVTWNPLEAGSCILWYMDQLSHAQFTALGKFSSFDKRKVLEFAVKYATSPKLRDELAQRQFRKKVEGITISYFDHIEKLTLHDKELAYRNLFNLDSEIEKEALSIRRKIMVKKFHPDLGGDHRAMAIINEAYEYLSKRTH